MGGMLHIHTKLGSSSPSSPAAPYPSALYACGCCEFQQNNTGWWESLEMGHKLLRVCCDGGEAFEAPSSEQIWKHLSSPNSFSCRSQGGSNSCACPAAMTAGCECEVTAAGVWNWSSVCGCTALPLLVILQGLHNAPVLALGLLGFVLLLKMLSPQWMCKLGSPLLNVTSLSALCPQDVKHAKMVRAERETPEHLTELWALGSPPFTPCVTGAGQG